MKTFVRWVVLAPLLSGCATLLGDDFDDRSNDPPEVAGSAGYGGAQGGAGQGGLSGASGQGGAPAQGDPGGSSGQGGVAGLAGKGGEGGAGAPAAGSAGVGGEAGAGEGGTGGASTTAGQAGSAGQGGVSGAGNGGVAGSAGVSAGASGSAGLNADCTGGRGPKMVRIPTPNGGTMCIDSTEVTRAQYDEFIQAIAVFGDPAQSDVCQWNDSFPMDPDCTDFTDVCDESQRDCSNHPVVCVDWCDAQAYCAWAGKRLCGAIGGGSTPYGNASKDVNVSQWMNACASGMDANVYPYGDSEAPVCHDLEHSKCNPDTYSGCHSSEVGSLSQCQPTGAYAGVFDLSGNVWEWEDSCETSEGSLDHCRLRGGSYFESRNLTTCMIDLGKKYAHRRRGNYSNTGFRCCGP